ncbi:hypothetical protein ACFVXC_10640 [Streptomyces sp. NPDC058257]|uniref:hypothetical protein n=1 Tax=Streptomyces sp. NPDC058257 TaxID=3346409 RepID=UPI0036E1EB92
MITADVTPAEAPEALEHASAEIRSPLSPTGTHSGSRRADRGTLPPFDGVKRRLG